MKSILIALVSASLASALALPAQADPNYPSRPITLVVTQAAGGGMDSAARMLGKKLSALLGQSIVIENRPGASENIGINAAAKATPDGYTLLMCSNGLSINPILFRNLPYDPKELAPIGKIASVPLLIVASATEPYRNLSELIAYAKANPNKLSYASPGSGSAHHLGMELVKSAAQAPIQHIPYKGAAPALNDLLAGSIPLLVASVPPVEPHIRSGKLRALATTYKSRLPQLPDVPTASETLPGLSVEAWMGLFSPAETPQAIRTKLSETLKSVLNDPEMIAGFDKLGMVANYSPPAELTAEMAKEQSNWAAAAKQAGMQPE